MNNIKQINTATSDAWTDGEKYQMINSIHYFSFTDWSDSKTK